MKFKLLLIIILIINSTRADLPVHCLSSQIEGYWLLHLGSNDHDNSLKCGHTIPDRNMDNLKVVPSEIFTEVNEIIVQLERPNKVLSVVDNTNIGNWTMIYDEGFEFSIKNILFFAFSKYMLEDGKISSNNDTIESEGYSSVCDKTLIGWFHNIDDNSHWGCFYGEKVDISKYNINGINYDNLQLLKKVPLKYLRSGGNTQNNVNNNSAKNNGAIMGTTNFEDFVKKVGGTDNYNNIPHLDIYFMDNKDTKNTQDEDGQQSSFLSLRNKLYENDLEYVNKINSDPNSTWKAKAYDMFEGKTYSHMRSLLGNSLNPLSYMKDPPPERENNFGDEMERMNSFESFIEISSRTSTSNLLKEMPSSFTWTDIDGVNYDSPVRTQGECGSCYSISAISVMESRIRIKSNNRLKPILSPSSAVGCSKYNQGCFGGYPFLVGKFGKEVGFVEDSCHPYEENDEKCIGYCFNQKVYKVKDYGYVGGYYGNCDEQKMMEEIYLHGPIVVAINATPELYYYDKGVFKSTASRMEGIEEKGVKPWQYTNHAVVCVGWGEELDNNGNNMKYWLLKNSWGDNWGLNGYFKMERGTNNGSVEAQGVYLNPEYN